MDESKIGKPNIRKKSILFCCTSALVFPGIAYSQADSSNENDNYRINTITVYGQAIADNDAESIVAQELWVGGKVATSILDTPASVSVITEKEITQRNASTTEEVLQYTPGLITDYFGSDDRNDYFKIRGFEATTYRDGMTLGSMRGVREDPYAFERVEVIRGANSTLFGPADPGGSVNFVSKRPKFESFTDGYVSYGSFNHIEGGLDVGDTVGESETVAYRFTAKIKDSDLEYDHSKDNSQLIMGSITWQPSNYTSATFIVDYLGRDSTPNSGGYALDKEYDRSNFYGEPDYNKHDVERTNLTAQVEHDFDNGLILRGNLRYSKLEDDLGFIYLSDTAGRTGSEVPRSYFGTDTSSEQLIGNTILQYSVSFDRVDSSTLVGLEYSNSSSQIASVYGAATSIDIDNPIYSGAPTSLNVYSKNDQDNTTKAIFLQQNLSLDDRYILIVGVRHDQMELSNIDINGAYTSDDFNETSFRAAFTYKVNEQLSTYISQVESVAPPSIGVKPERGEQLELGVKFSPESINALFSAAVYDLEKNDVTIAVVQDNGNIVQETIGKSRAQGLDLEMKAEFSEDFNIIAGYSYMETEVINSGNGSVTEGNEFTEAPNHSASLWGNYTLPNKMMNVSFGARYIGSYYFDAANSAKSEAATLFDASFAYQVSKVADLSVNVANLLDKQYVVGSGTANFYNPGREISANLHYSW